MKTNLPLLAFRHPDLFGFDLNLHTPPDTPARPAFAPAPEHARHDFLVPNLRPDLIQIEPTPRFTRYTIDLP